jgi:hypothetical protein
VSDKFNAPPEAVAATDQALAASSGYLDALAGAYLGALKATGDMPAIGVLTSAAKGLDRPMLEGLFVTAVRRLALYEPSHPDRC